MIIACQGFNGTTTRLKVVYGTYHRYGIDLISSVHRVDRIIVADGEDLGILACLKNCLEKRF
jgi:hypothetical protein